MSVDLETGPAGPEREGTAETFIRALYEDAAGPVFNFVLRLTGDRALAEEVVQEAFLRAWRHARRLDLGPDTLRRWLFTVARNIVIDLWRSNSIRLTIVSDERALGTARAYDDIESAVQRWALSDALNRITPKQRAVLITIYYEGNSIAEAARRLGVSPGTVKSRTYHALRALRLVVQALEAA
jgi:RNA polymerase sigma-70 factor (ECF subfamily)